MCIRDSLVPPHVIDAHDGREDEVLPVDPSPRVGDAQVQHYRHGLFGNLARLDVAIGTDCAAVHLECRLPAHLPDDVRVLSLTLSIIHLSEPTTSQMPLFRLPLAK